MNIYVGNLPYGMGNDELRELFAQYGAVKSAKVIIDRETDRSKGFGFVEMESDSDAKTAIESLDGSDVSGRRVKVNEARPRPPRN
jgi:RNA recognition motif-containing protein